MTSARKVVLLITPSRAYTRGLLEGVAKFARLSGIWAFYRPLEYREPLARGRLLEVLRSLRPDGVFMREPPEMEAIIEMGPPVVSFPYSRETIPGAGNGVVDHLAVGRMAARHLLERGFRCFGYCGFQDWWWSRRRGQGFAEVVSEAGHEVHVYHAPGRRRRSWAEELPLVAAWLRGLSTPAGVLACNDDRGELVIEAAKAAGIRVPQEVAVLGVDNDAIVCDLCHPPLSSIALNVERAGFQAARLLDRLMNGERPTETRIPIEPTHIVERQSTDVLAVDDAEVAAAISFIRQNAKRNIRVQDVLEHVSVSRRVLERRFRRALGNSMHAEIRRSRVGLITRLLHERRLSIAQIARTLDFDDATHLSRYFRKEMGLSPLQYRKQRT